MIRYKSVGWMTLVLTGLVGRYAIGQDEGAAELYGRGVHAYFAADYDLAVELLSKSIEKYGLDPRSFYFRGLAEANRKGLDAGLADFTQGADVEINRTDRPVYDINGALQRIQGHLRLELEKVRTATRKAAVERKKKRDVVRYEELKRREDIVLFDPNRPAPQVKLDLPKPDLGGQPDPFDDGMAFSGGKQVADVVVEPVQPAGEPAPPGDAGQPRDPFSAANAEEEGKGPAEPADPFASPGKNAADPFGLAAPAPKVSSTAKPKPKPKSKSEPPVSNPPANPNPFGENMPKLDLPVEEEPAAPAANIGRGLIDLLGKTLSGAATDRDPFGEAKTETPAQGGPAEKTDTAPPADPALTADAAPTTDAAPPADAAPTADPFAEGASKKAEAKKPVEKAADPFK
ncbi:MAG: hypothetical protein ACYC3X_16540 [Pirellulaceae bacterium]